MHKQWFKASKSIQQGFTLVEMVVVVAVIGILIALVSPSISGSKDGANAKLMTNVAQQINANWMLLTNTAGVTTISASNPVLASGKNIHNVIFGGKTNVASTYQKFWDQAGLLPVTANVGVDATGCASSGYRVAGYCVTAAVASPGTAMTVTFNDVPGKLAEKLAQQADPNTAFTRASTGTTQVGVELSLVETAAGSGVYNAIFTKAIVN